MTGLSEALNNKINTSSGEVKARYEEIKNLVTPTEPERENLQSVREIAAEMNRRLAENSFTLPVYHTGAGQFFPAGAQGSQNSTESLSTQIENSQQRLERSGLSNTLFNDIVNVGEQVSKEVEHHFKENHEAKSYGLNDWGKAFLLLIADLALGVVSETIQEFVHWQIERAQEVEARNEKEALLAEEIELMVDNFSENLSERLAEKKRAGELDSNVSEQEITDYVSKLTVIYQEKLEGYFNPE
ncbi:hypothetical protein [Pleionea sediminis]|uniref:hypothetical protein n=1 Tax=Pleionea sediminis TaxID=2569479 RepID=UPI001184A4BA|nr:hypothetical protein [Pleionea sediminis]